MSDKIFKYPVKYFQLYSELKNGGSIREWVDKVESLSKDILNLSPEYNMVKIRMELANNVKVFSEYENIVCFTGFNEQQGKFLESIGAIYSRYGIYTISSERLAKYTQKDEINVFKGDMLEFFAWMFFNAFKNDESLGLTDYKAVELDSDFGVDATGRNVNGRESVIQVKYRKNPTDLIAYADIARTFTSALCQLHINDVYTFNHTVFLFTTANGVSGAFDKVMGEKCVIVSRGIIATKIDNNVSFWTECYNKVFEMLN